ncbi:SIMPL domain-containing protein [Candidatus Parcubacteria bacterium]|nr:SIMPL domain-containing protein [Patescibacteria group bacterium]MCG2689643.1 SIMPL domain-containing protein [Candidatus Parcubacteria bacterium]
MFKIMFPMRTVMSRLFIIGLILLTFYFFPWKNINWGRVTFNAQQSIAVTGTSELKVSNQTASFSAGVTAYNDNKEIAIKGVNDKIASIIGAVKSFGVLEEDIKTQSLSIYQNSDYVYEGDRQKQKPGQWNVSNTIEINLKDISKASDLATLLASTGATNVYGPNFSLDDKKTRDTEKTLLSEAIADARSKAEIIAKSAGKTLGGIVTVSESGSYSPSPLYRMDSGIGGGGGAPVEPGSSTIQKTVYVTFELK